MNHRCHRTVARAQDLDEIGVTLLRAMTTKAIGAGIRVARPEVEISAYYCADNRNYCRL